MYLGTVLRDRRERRPWAFDRYPVETRDVTLSTGDYAVASCCSRDAGTDTYHPTFAIERKTGGDFLNSITWDRERFEGELERAESWPEPLPVVVEEQWETFAGNRGPMGWRDVRPSQVRGTVSAWSDRHNVAFLFLGSRQAGELYALCRLLEQELGTDSREAEFLRRKLETLYLVVRAQTRPVEEIGLAVDQGVGEER